MVDQTISQLLVKYKELYQKLAKEIMLLNQDNSQIGNFCE